MSWAAEHIQTLREGRIAIFRPVGGSMSPLIESGQLCTVEPIGQELATVGEVVLCRVNGNDYLHLIKKVAGSSFQIGNNRGGINGWVGHEDIFGRLIKIEGRDVPWSRSGREL